MPRSASSSSFSTPTHSKINSRVLIRAGKVVEAADAFEKLTTDQRLSLMFAVKVSVAHVCHAVSDSWQHAQDGVMTMDESIAAAAVIETAAQEGDSKHVQSVLDEILAKHAAVNATKPKKPSTPESKGTTPWAYRVLTLSLTQTHSESRQARARGSRDWGGGPVSA